MKLKLASSLLLTALAASSVYAASTITLTKDMATTDPWESYIDYVYTLGPVNIHLGQSINYGAGNDVYIYWNSKNSVDGNYTLTGSGKLSGYGIRWRLGKGTYEITEGVSMGNHVSISGTSGTEIIFNSGCKVWELYNADQVRINSSKFKITDYIGDVNVVQAGYGVELTTKNLPGLFSGVEVLEGNLTVNGGKWHTFPYTTLTVKGTATFKGSTNIDIYLTPTDNYEGVFYSKPTAEDINNTLRECDGEILMTCLNYTGNLSSLKLRGGYFNSNWAEKYISISSYGSFLPVFNEEDLVYDIVFKHHESSYRFTTPNSSSSTTNYYTPGDNDIYMAKNVTLSGGKNASITWDAYSRNLHMYGKGLISSKEDLSVNLMNGTFNIGDKTGFKNADIVVWDANVLLSKNSPMESLHIMGTDTDFRESQSRLFAGTGKLNIANALEIYRGGLLTIQDSLTAESVELNRGFIQKSNSKSATISIKDDFFMTDSELSGCAKLTVGKTLDMYNSTLHLLNIADPKKALGLTVKGDMVMTSMSNLRVNGGISADNLTITDSNFSLESTKALSVKVKGDGKYTNSIITVTGSMSHDNLFVDGGNMFLYDPTGKGKAQNLTAKKTMSILGCTAHLNGKLSAKNLTLGNGCTLNMTSAKLNTVKVGGTLTLNGSALLQLGFTVKEKDVEKGKAYTLFTFKNFEGNLANLTLGYEGAYTLDFNTKRTAITLVIEDAEKWNNYAAYVQAQSSPTSLSLTSAADEDVSGTDADTTPLPVTTAYTVDPMLAGLADTLVQSSWGVAGASRAFADTISGRGAHATLLEGGKGAAWVSVMGGSSRISSDGGHTGADFTLSGAAIGIEGNVTEKSTIGLAIGNSWGKVSPFSAYRVDQDSTHYGLYGNHTLRHNLTLSWMAAHTRTESDGNLAGMDCDWTQDALQLDARLTWARALNEKTVVSAFGGLQYLATDSADFNGLSTGSVQNLRTEIGAGITHKAAPATQVYGELSFIGDVARNNPTATVGDYRTRGANPGRVGLNLHIGAAHQLNDSWSVNAGYSFELQKNATSHGLNVGASYKF